MNAFGEDGHNLAVGVNERLVVCFVTVFMLCFVFCEATWPLISKRGDKWRNILTSGVPFIATIR